MASRSSTGTEPSASPDRKRARSRKELKQVIKDLKLEQAKLAAEHENYRTENERLRQEFLLSKGSDVFGESQAIKLGRLLTVNVLKKTLADREKEFQRQLSLRDSEIKQLREGTTEALDTEEMERLQPCDLASEVPLGSEETQEDEGNGEKIHMQAEKSPQAQGTHIEIQTDSTATVHTWIQTDPREREEQGTMTFQPEKYYKQVQTDSNPAPAMHPSRSLTTMETMKAVCIPGTKKKLILRSINESYKALYEAKCGECECLRRLIRKPMQSSQSVTELPPPFEAVTSPIRCKQADSSSFMTMDMTLEIKEAKLKAKEASLKLYNAELKQREKRILECEKGTLAPGWSSVRLRKLDGK